MMDDANDEDSLITEKFRGYFNFKVNKNAGKSNLSVVKRSMSFETR